MSDKISLRVVRHSDLAGGGAAAGAATAPDTSRGDDPDQIAAWSPVMRRAFLTNPWSRAGDPVQIVGLIGGRIVGQMRLLAGALQVRGQEERVFYGSGLYVAPEHRATWLGLMILVKTQSLHRTVGACGITQLSRPLYPKLGWTIFDLPRTVLLRRSRSVLDSMLHRRALARVGALGVDAALLVQRGALSLRRRWRCGGLTVRQIEQVPDSWGPLLARDTAAARTCRSAAGYRWMMDVRFGEDPSLRRRLVVVEDRGGSPLVIFVTKCRFYETATQRQLHDISLGSLQDWQILDPERMAPVDVALLACRVLAEDAPDAIEISTPDPAMAASLRRVGFVSAGALQFLFRAAPESPLADPALHQLSQWDVRPADGDNFFS